VGGVRLAGGSRCPDEGAEGSLEHIRSPGQQSCRGTRLTPGPSAEPEEASGRLRAESQIEPWFAVRENRSLPGVQLDRELNSR
jgi:hypothetical protein